MIVGTMKTRIENRILKGKVRLMVMHMIMDTVMKKKRMLNKLMLKKIINMIRTTTWMKMSLTTL